MDAVLDSQYGIIARNFSLVSQGPGFAADTYIAGSALPVPGEGLVPGIEFQWRVNLSKTAAGIATPILVFRLGTTGTVADTAVLTLTGQAAVAAVAGGTLTAEAFVTKGLEAAANGELRGAFSAGASFGGGIDGVSAALDLRARNGQFLGLSLNAGAAAAYTVSHVRAKVLG